MHKNYISQYVFLVFSPLFSFKLVEHWFYKKLNKKKKKKCLLIFFFGGEQIKLEIEMKNLNEQLDMQKAEIQEEREAKNTTKKMLLATKAEVDDLKGLIKQFMAS